MTTAEILYLVLGVVGPAVLHAVGAVDLSKIFPARGPAGLPALPAQLPPPVIPLPNHPAAQGIEQALEAYALRWLQTKVQALTPPAAPAAQ